jgi:hypothetical protein
MSKFVGVILGGLAIAVGVLIDIGTFGALTPLLVGLAAALLTAGTGLVLSGVGTLISGSAQQMGAGIAFASRNPIKSWDVIYGYTVVGGTVVYILGWETGDGNYYLDLVVVLCAHQVQSIDRLLFDKQFVQLNGNGDSFSPVQQNINIQHIARTNGIVQVTLPADIPLLQVGDRIAVQNITGDYTLNGTFPVAEIIRQVYEIGTPGALIFRYVCGGGNSIVDNEGQVLTVWPDYGAKVHMETMLGAQTLGETFPGMLGSGTPIDGNLGNLVQNPHNPWTANCSLVGKACVFLRLHYSAAIFSGGLPAISFEVHGKNDIYDPRLGAHGGVGTTGYTDNAALVIADYLSMGSSGDPNTGWGFKAVWGTELPTATYIAEANICDEDVPLAIGGSIPYSTGTVTVTHGSTTVTGAGTTWTAAMDGGAIIVGGYIATILSASGTSMTLRAGFAGPNGSAQGYEIAYGAGFEPRYQADGTFDLSHSRGVILQNLLTSCAGRLSFQAGQYILQTGSWRGASPAPAPSMGSMSGGFRWKTTPQIRDLYNGVKGTYICPANNWHAADIPPYCQDSLHGYSGPSDYGGDSNLAADGGDRRWFDMQLPFTTSPSRAQRICKIELLRRRFWGTGTFRYNMIGYQFTALDVISMNLTLFSWTAKTLEIAAHRFVIIKQVLESGEEVSALGTEIDVQETDASIYDWSTTEELSPEGYAQPYLANPFTPSPPTGLTLESDLSTAVSTPAGLSDAIQVSWTAPADGYVIEGGHIEVQYQEVFSYLTGSAGATNGSVDVTGVGTDWTTAMEGGAITIQGAPYTVATVTGAGALTLTIVFAGITATGLSYAIAYPDAWTGLPSVSPSVTQVLITGVDDGAIYNVQIRSVNASGFPSSWVAGSVIARGASLPYAWKPGYEPYLFAESGYSFGGQVGPVTASIFGFSPGIPAGVIALKGNMPVNTESATAGMPVIDRFATVAAHSGNTLPVISGFLQVFGIDSGGARSESSNISQFNVIVTASRVSFGVTWGVNTVAYEVFVGWDLDAMVGLGAVTPGSLPATINLDSFADYPGIYGPPDPRAVSALVRGKQVIHAGILACNVASKTSTTVVVGMPAAATVNFFVGRYLILPGTSGTAFGHGIIGPITASDTGSPLCTLTIASGLGVGGDFLGFGVDQLIFISMLSDTNTATSIGDSGTLNPFYPTGMVVDDETGEIVRVIWDPTGVGWGAQATVLSNTDAVSQTTQFLLPDGTPVTPGAGSAFIYEAATWGASNTVEIPANSTAPTLAGPNPALALVLNDAPLGGDAVLVQILLRDANGNLSDETTDTLRMFYVPPAPSMPLASMFVNGTLAIESDAAPNPYMVAASSPSFLKAYVKQSPTGAGITFTITAGGSPWASVTIAAGTTSAIVANPGAIVANSPIVVSISAVGTTFPGADLSIFLYS